VAERPVTSQEGQFGNGNVTDPLNPPPPLVAAMGATRAPVERPTGGRLDDRVLETLQGLRGRVAFSGLRRVLGAHPESLTRSLVRLEREGLVERADGGYRALGPSPPLDAPSPAELRSIAHIELPRSLDPRGLLGRLTGRWFGTLRWVGTIERPSERLLAWARRDGSGLALLGIRDGFLKVYVPGGTTSDDPAESEEAAFELLFHAVEAVRPTALADDASEDVRVRALAATELPWTLEN
jgi:hypothetical protein